MMLALLLALALEPSGASAAGARYASPIDIGSGDCLSEASSCDLPTAVTGAAAGDDIYVRGDAGDYALSAQLTNPNAIHVHGTHGRPRLIFSGERFTLESGSSVEKLYVQMSAPFGDVQLTGSTGDNLVVLNTGPDHAIFMEDSTLTNSVAWNSAANTSSIELDGDNTLRNVTAYAPANGGIAIIALGRTPPASGPVTDAFVNVIARGGEAGGAGIRAKENNGIDLTVNVGHSNYSSADTTGTVDGSKTHLNTDATDQTGAPLFADAANGDFHQLSGSPTIDHGVNDAANGSVDVDGDARTLNGVTDIGADEFIPGSNPTPIPPPTIPPPTDPKLLVCVGLWTSSCAGFPKPSPVQTCVSLWQNCNGFGGSAPAGPGKIDLSGLPSQITTSAGCKENKTNPFGLRSSAQASQNRGTGFELQDERGNVDCTMTTYLQSDDPKAVKEASKQVEYDLNLRDFRAEADVVHGSMIHGVFGVCRQPGDSLNCRVGNALAVALDNGLKKIFEQVKEEGTPVKTGYVLDASICRNYIGKDYEECGQLFTDLGKLIRTGLTGLATRKHALGVDKPFKPARRLAVPGAQTARAGSARAKIKRRIALGFGKATIKQGKRGKLTIKFPKAARQLLKRVKRRGRRSIQATAVVTATIIPGISTTKRYKVTLLLRRPKHRPS